MEQADSPGVVQGLETKDFFLIELCFALSPFSKSPVHKVDMTGSRTRFRSEPGLRRFASTQMSWRRASLSSRTPISSKNRQKNGQQPEVSFHQCAAIDQILLQQRFDIIGCSRQGNCTSATSIDEATELSGLHPKTMPCCCHQEQLSATKPSRQHRSDRQWVISFAKQ